MIEVILNDAMPNEVMDIVRELRQNGYKQGTHFDFEYHKPKYDYFNSENDYNRFTIFSFYHEELATWFSLKYL